LIEAIVQARSGRNVVVLEASERMAGAWGTHAHSRFGETEIGCHIIEKYRGIYEWMNRFGIAVEPMVPQPAVLFGKRELPYDWKWNYTMLESLKKHLKKGTPLGYLRETRQRRMRFRLLHRKHWYLTTGSIGLRDFLEQEVSRLGIDIRFNHRVIDIKHVNGRVQLTGNFGEMTCPEVIVFSLTELESANSEKVQYRPQEYHHLHVLVTGKLSKPFSYLRVFGNPVIHRASIINAYASGLEEDQHLLLFGIHTSAMASSEHGALAQQSVDYLESCGYVEQCRIMHVEHNVYPCQYLSEATKNTLKSISGVRIIHSTNLGLFIRHNMKRWDALMEGVK
jgi:hypothetical protein